MVEDDEASNGCDYDCLQEHQQHESDAQGYQAELEIAKGFVRQGDEQASTDW